MNIGDTFTYVEMISKEGKNLQHGMNFELNRKEHGVILFGLDSNTDIIEENGTEITYQGHDDRGKGKTSIDVTKIDQPIYMHSGSLTENGKFYISALEFKNTGRLPKKINIYDKNKVNDWVYRGSFYLVDACFEKSGDRNVFKFKLSLIEYAVEQESLTKDSVPLSPSRPAMVRMTRDKAMQQFRAKGIEINSKALVYATKKEFNLVYEVAPNRDFIKEKSYMILNDNLAKKLYLFAIPAKKLNIFNMVVKIDNGNVLLDLKIRYFDSSFTDIGSKVTFKEFLVKQLDY